MLVGRCGSNSLWEVMSMSEWLHLIASVEWIALGIIFFRGLRIWNKKFSDMYDELQEKVEGLDNG